MQYEIFELLNEKRVQNEHTANKRNVANAIATEPKIEKRHKIDATDAPRRKKCA